MLKNITERIICYFIPTQFEHKINSTLILIFIMPDCLVTPQISHKNQEMNNLSTQS